MRTQQSHNHGYQDYQSLMGKERMSGEVATATKHIWWLTYANKSEKRSNTAAEKLEVIKKKS